MLSVAAPAAMTGQWQDELAQKFGINFTIVDREYLAGSAPEPGLWRQPMAGRFALYRFRTACLGDETYADGLKDALGEFRPRGLFILDRGPSRCTCQWPCLCDR